MISTPTPVADQTKFILSVMQLGPSPSFGFFRTQKVADGIEFAAASHRFPHDVLLDILISEG